MPSEKSPAPSLSWKWQARRASGQGLAGSKSKLFWTLEEKHAIYNEVQPEAKVARLLENVVMKEEDAAQISTARVCKPVRSCPAGRFCLRRPRLFWADWSLDGLLSTTMKGGPLWNTLMLEGPRLSIWQFLPTHEHVDKEFEAFACFMQGTRRKRPPLKPAGLHICDAMTLKRWQLDEYRFPPYQYNPLYLVKKARHKSELRREQL